MRPFIFITQEGHTFQPNSEASLPDVDNMQVLGFAKGHDENEAFENLLNANEWLSKTFFDEVQCLELKHLEYHSQAKIFSLKNVTACSK